MLVAGATNMVKIVLFNHNLQHTAGAYFFMVGKDSLI